MKYPPHWQHGIFSITTTFTIVDGHGLTLESENLKAIIRNEMDRVSQDGNQMAGFIGPVAMAPYCR
jgi:hypothetical protein